jgi:hypothetical protein
VTKGCGLRPNCIGVGVKDFEAASTVAHRMSTFLSEKKA